MKKYTGRIVMLGSIMTALFITLFLVLKSLPYNPYPFENLDAEVTLPESIDVPEFIKNVYVHGTNSEKRLREYEKFYENFELDVNVGGWCFRYFPLSRTFNYSL
uniref:Uncharacterized protein n=2 Tax=Vibrio alginolyticus TaxID=663 RepID=C8CE69_VIBAL|nr:hypothetical protein pVAE259_00035 [Vibrio alginolyticus]